MQKITPFLWLNEGAEEAVEFYKTVFKNSKVLAVTRYPEGTPGPAGSVMTAVLSLEGLEVVLLNGGPHYKLTPAFSFVLHCEDQKELDYYWDRLTKGGKAVQCGWLEDKFGVSWQVVPEKLTQWLTDKNPAKGKAVMAALLKMKKLDIKTLQKAADSV